MFLNVCKQTSHISSVHISRTKRCFIVKSSAYYFHMKTKMLADFQACISVPLMHTVTRKPLTIYWKPLTVFTKSSSWDVWQGSEYVSVCNGLAAALVCLTSSKRHNFLACFFAHRFFCFLFLLSVFFLFLIVFGMNKISWTKNCPYSLSLSKRVIIMFMVFYSFIGRKKPWRCRHCKTGLATLKITSRGDLLLTFTYRSSHQRFSVIKGVLTRNFKKSI